jgi:hypothetical protein
MALLSTLTGVPLSRLLLLTRLLLLLAGILVLYSLAGLLLMLAALILLVLVPVRHFFLLFGFPITK